MTDDPNADLIGYEYDTPVGRARVVGSWELNDAYVLVAWVADPPGAATEIRPASVVRRAKQLS